MRVIINKSQEKITIAVEGNLEATAIKTFNDKIAQITEFNKSVEVDMANVEYVDSSGIRALLSLSKKVKESGHAFSLINCSENVKRILKLTTINEIR